MGTKDLFSGHAADYSKFRPTYPPELFGYLGALVDKHDLVWDCATGNGQAARDLAPLFRRVHATDLSAAQLEAAPKLPNVTYVATPAERSGLPDGCCDLVTVAQALHWLPFQTFWTEVKRVLRPGGAVAAWSYAVCQVTPAIDDLVQDYYERTLGPYWEPERRHVDSGYRDIPFPFDELPPPRLEMKASWTAEQFVGYLSSWSATKTAIKKAGADPLAPLAPKLFSLWGSGERSVSWPLHVRAGRV